MPTKIDTIVAILIDYRCSDEGCFIVLNDFNGKQIERSFIFDVNAKFKIIINDEVNDIVDDANFFNPKYEGKKAKIIYKMEPKKSFIITKIEILY